MKTIFYSMVFCFFTSTGFAQFQHSFGTERLEIGRSLTQLQKVEKGYLIAGYTSKEFFGNLEATLVKTDLDGNQIWSRVYGGKQYEYFNSVRQSNYFSANNKVSYVATGLTASYGFGAEDGFFIGVDKDGFPVFSAVFGGKQYDTFHCVQSIKDKNGKPGYILVGETRSYQNIYPDTNICVVQTDYLGNFIKATIIGGRGDQRGFWIEQSQDGGYIIAGSSTNYRCGGGTALPNKPVDIFAIKLDPDLNVDWNRILGYPNDLDPSFVYRNGATCVKQNKQGNFVFTGYTNSFGLSNSYDAFLLYLDRFGNFLGLKTYGTEKRELGNSLEETFNSSGDQRYTVVGLNTISSTKAMLFQTDGGANLQWARNYGDSGNEIGMELVKDDFDKGFAFTGYTTSLGAGSTDIYVVETTEDGKSDTPCEKEIDLKEVRHRPCVTSSVQQVFVRDYKRIDHPVEKLEYEKDLCRYKSSKVDTSEEQLFDNEKAIRLFPNPVNKVLTIQTNITSQVKEVKIFDIHGNEVIENIQIGGSGEIVLSAEVLSEGVYIVKLYTEDGESHIMRFLKK